MHKKNYSIFLIIVLAALLIAVVIWISGKRIREIERQLDQPSLETK